MTEPVDFKVKYAKITDLREVADIFLALRDEHDEFKREAAEVWAELEYVKKVLGPELMGDQTLVKWEGYPFRLQKQSDIYAGCPGGVDDSVKDWLFSNDGEALVKDTVNSSALKSFLKKRLLAGKPIPTDLFKVEPYDFIKVVKK